MRTHTLHIGEWFNTEMGQMHILSFNGNYAVVAEYLEDDFGDLKYDRERRLTLQEIAREFKNIDGRNHKIEIV